MAVDAAHTLLSVADHDALPLHELACAALAMVEDRTQGSCTAASADPPASNSASPTPWLQRTAELLRKALVALAETGSLAAVAERAAASVCRAVASMSALPATEQVRRCFVTHVESVRVKANMTAIGVLAMPALLLSASTN